MKEWYNGLMAHEDWITTAQAAELSGYSIQYVRRLIRNGKIEARKFGPVWQVNRAALVAYIAEGERSEDGRRGPKD